MTPTPTVKTSISDSNSSLSTASGSSRRQSAQPSAIRITMRTMLSIGMGGSMP